MREVVRGRRERAGRGAGRGARQAGPAAPDRRAVLGFLLRLLVGWAIATGVLSLLPGIEGWAVDATVASVSWVLRVATLDPAVSGATIALGRVALRIIPECTPLMPTLMLGIAVLAYRAPVRWKLVGLIAGATGLWIYNVIRMLALMATLKWWPGSFHFVHVYLWQTVTLLVVCALFLLWLRVGATPEATA